jgi:hypothetical protein
MERWLQLCNEEPRSYPEADKLDRQHQDCNMQPLGFTGGDELINDTLSVVGEVTELSFPHHQSVGGSGCSVPVWLCLCPTVMMARVLSTLPDVWSVGSSFATKSPVR